MSGKKDTEDAWVCSLQIPLRRQEPLRFHTSFKIGGPARYLVSPCDETDLKVLLKGAKQYKIPIYILGAGSNLLVSDAGVAGIVIKLSEPLFTGVVYDGETVHAGGGVFLSTLISESAGRGLSALENLAGIPGTVGGAVMMNAGVAKKFSDAPVCIGEAVTEVRCMDYDGEVSVLPGKSIRFGYRTSDLSGFIILGVTVVCTSAPAGKLKEAIRRCLCARGQSQELSLPSAGCVFRNPAGHAAGKLIDSAGFKGVFVNGAGVSEKHANFIVNRGNATFADVEELMNRIREKVRSSFQIELEPEIRIWK